MIAIDYSQLAIASVAGNFASLGEINESVVRYLILNGIRKLRVKFKNQYQEVVIACDSSSYWRKDIFPHYKFKRKKMKEDSKIDWELVYKCLKLIKGELIEYSPYKVLEIDKAEGDDIIAVLAKWSHENDLIQDGLFISPKPFLVASRDEDFIQLQKYPHIKQYSPITKKFITPTVSPHIDLKEKIIRGDDGDSIPNFLSVGNSFVDKIRQKSIMTERMPEYLKTDFSDDEHFKRNQLLIDFDYIPDDISSSIIDQYTNYKVNSRMKFMNYFIQYRLKNLMECMGDF
ncbi:hypothetical protein M0R04_04275 [Candidatus Dojkabacteria bacterium]|jgi:hypothetical protein|nr:hypothetical protein [Candidatus Dojkabacteria bacterium]